MMKGLTAGITLIMQWGVLLNRAMLTGNNAAVSDLMAVFSAWWGEAAVVRDASAMLRFTGKLSEIRMRLSAIALILGADPFTGSRELFKAVVVKYPELQ